MSDASFDEFEPEVERYELRESLGPFFPHRRLFVKAAGSGLMLAVALDAQQAAGQRRRSARREETLSERFLIGADGTVTVFTSKVEVGQGSRTQLTQAAAEELGLEIERIHLVMADTKLCPNDGGTAGSRTTPSTVPRVRNAAAVIRDVLKENAAARMGKNSDDVVLKSGAFWADGKSVTLAELATDKDLAAKLKSTTSGESVEVTAVEDWTVLGTSVDKITGVGVVTGAHRYPSDIRRPGMLYGRILRAASYEAELQSVDLEPARGTEGVTVVREKDFIGCVAETTYEAEQALSAIAATAKWSSPEQVSSEQLFEHFKSTAQDRGRAEDSGAFEQSLAGGERQLEARYTVDYIQHAPMEPRAAVAEWTDEGLTVWTGTQQPDRVHSELTRAFQLSSEMVRVIVPDTGGGFGGKHTGEVAVEAARLAKAAGKPVHVRWTREEEFTWAYFRPAGLMEIRSGVDAAGKIVAWDHVNYNSGGSAIDSPYRIPNASTRFIRTDYPLRQGSYRALASTANTFARESAMDELALLTGQDALAFRLQHLDEGRLKDVLLAATKNFNWESVRGKRVAGRGVGLACGTEKGSYVAACAEVEADGDEFKVLKVCQAFECGAIQNPDNLRSQVEGALIQGLGGALFESISFRDGRIGNDNFSSYRVPRMSDLPELEIVLVNRQDLPSVGGSETPIIAVAPAVANALAMASGTRAHSLPLKMT